MTSDHPLADDLDFVLSRTEGLWESLHGQTLFLTGGTGFFGRWLLESFVWANERLALGAQAVVLTRQPETFQSRAPHLAANPAVRLVRGDVRNFDFPAGDCAHVIHAAADFNPELQATDPDRVTETILAGTRRTLEFARHARAQNFLYISSGAVYGRQPADVASVPEEFNGAPDPQEPGTVYGLAKRQAEQLCLSAAQAQKLNVKIARGFAFVGPHLPQDSFYAIGNFIRDARRGGPVRVRGDGTPLRSYLYAADLAVWLWHILLRGQNGRAYNVGSDAGLTIADTARTVAECFIPPPPVMIERQTSPALAADCYVPNIERARLELQLAPWTSLREAILKTIAALA